ncbi:GEVED domain-containing protein [Winogradskyella forsetii]|uniref:GEVED domain-containing protein n=1 Tax=Winogradskyella forsetii TaxID=2686077 RepID=UPI0015B954A3|nr:GEVED domain-containing protein [Winogradskyella forsetii]
MKNKLHSPLYCLFNICLNFDKKPIVLLLFTSLLLTSSLAQAQLPQFDNFESGWGNWNDGGGDCELDNNGYINGNDTVRLRDDSGTDSSTFSDTINLTSYSSVTFSFLFYPVSMENGENFFVEYNDGSGYTTIANYIRGTHFNNDTLYSDSITLTSGAYNFSTNSRFRIRCDASGNGDYVYIDDINITGVTSAVSYCNPTGSDSDYYIDDFSTSGGVTNITNNNTGYSTNGYGNYTSLSASQYRGSSLNFFSNFQDPTWQNGFGFGLWVDFNDDGDFNDAGETLYNNGYIDPVNDSFTIPIGTTPGNYRMRIVADWDDATPSSCPNSIRGESEDYTLTVLDIPPCTEPTSQPTNLTFSSTTENSMIVNFTPAPSTADSFLVVYNTTGTIPGIGDNTTYNVGTYGGNIVIGNDDTTSFSLTGLANDTTYYFYVFAFNGNCSGGPDYLRTSPLTGNETTESYCIPSSTNSSRYIDDFSTTGGMANITNNNSGFSSNGYGNFTSNFVSQQAGLDIAFTANFQGGNHGFGIWVDFNNDGDFTDTAEQVYLSGSYADPISDTFTIPTATSLGSYRMRIVADRNDSTPNPCSISGSGGEAEDYTLNVVPRPPCAEPTDQPSNLSFNSTTETSMIMNFTPAPSTADSFLVVFNTTGVIPIIGDNTTYNVGTYGGNIVIGNDDTTNFSLDGLSSDTIYYFYVFAFNNSNCTGGPDYLMNPLLGSNATFEFCSPSNALGTSDLGCPSVDAGGAGLNGLDINLNCFDSYTTTLEAQFLELGDTSSYAVESIDYNPPFQYGCLANPVSVNVDDVWSDVINLPFDFCFYGTTYDSCVIGSNGVISFDTSLADSYSGWEITTDLPSFRNTDAGYFGPSIYGAHHDVDPSVGGEIGYQLITLDSGCQALVASWYQVPMYENNSIIYTGMMVFYEATNIIEVYIKEKNIDGTWNDGNGAIGLQRNGTEGIVAPDRNSLDDDWQVSEEAWRFVPSGPSITSLKWYENSISEANEIVDPNNDGQITVTPSDTTTYIAEVSYNVCDGPTLVTTDATTVTISGRKIWNGSVSSDWDIANNWTPSGVPVSTNCVVIPATSTDPVITGILKGKGYNLEIADGATLTQQSNSTLTIEDEIIIDSNGEFEIRDSANFIQVLDVTTNENIGIAKVQREVTGLNTYDYVYWSSPVETFNVSDISPSTSAGGRYEWTPTVNNGTAGNHGEWITTSGTMNIGQGYAIRDLEGTLMADIAQFNGKLNNGQITHLIKRGTYNGANYPGIGNTATAEDDNWNLIGNPYPSAISLAAFTAANPDIDGTLYFWRHNSAPSTSASNPFYDGYQYNYSANDYLSANNLGSTPFGFSDYIAAGQGFFVQLLHTAPQTTGIVFNNAMRGLYDNSGFYRSAGSTTDDVAESNEKHRIWLDLIDENNTALSVLIGYATSATDAIDRLYDGHLLNDTNYQFYSIVEDPIKDNKLAINGLALPFEDTDIIPLGFKAPAQGQFTIGINNLDGVFGTTDQAIYLEDTMLNSIHDLRANPYIFTSAQGTFDERFRLRFSTQTLSIKDQEALANLTITNRNSTIDAIAPSETIKTFELFDITGRVIHKNLKVDSANYSYQTHHLSRGTYVVTVKLTNGATKSKKLII